MTKPVTRAVHVMGCEVWAHAALHGMVLSLVVSSPTSQGVHMVAISPDCGQRGRVVWHMAEGAHGLT